MTAAYETAEQIDARLRKVESACRRLRLTEATLLRLKPGDILVMNTPRPLATSEQERITASFKEVCRQLGIRDVHLMVLCGEKVTFDVIRQENDG